MSYSKAKAFARKLKLKNEPQWQAYIQGRLKNKKKRPKNLPKRPYHFYIRRDRWVSWGDFLGTGRTKIKAHFWSYEKVKKYARGKKIKSKPQWRLHTKTKNFPKGKAPSDPSHFYKEKEWTSWANFLGTKNTPLHGRIYRKFKHTKKFVHTLKLKNVEEWWRYCRGEFKNKPKKPFDIPSGVYNVYKNHWISWKDFLGK